MAVETILTKRLKIAHPIIQAPMAGGGDTPELVAAVGNAGGIGFLGAAYSTPAQIIELGRAVRSKTSRPFGINLFAPLPESKQSYDAALAVQRVAPFFEELGLPVPSPPAPVPPRFDEQLAASLETDAATFSFTFGILPPSAIAAIKKRAVFLMGTATTVREAVALEEAGVDAVIAQGSEAGGHRGTFGGDFAAGMIGTISLVPQAVAAVGIPVIASGGIMDGRGITAALALGASAVQMGTAFLTCEEAGVPNAYKEAILHAREDETQITRAFSGRPARGIVNRFMKEVEADASANAILPFPLQNAMTRPLRAAAAKQNRAEFLSLWAGQGLTLARKESASALIARLVDETDIAVYQLQSARRKMNRAVSVEE